MNKQDSINGVTTFWFGFNDTYIDKIKSIVSPYIEKGIMEHEAWKNIGNALVEAGISDVSWNCDCGLAFYHINAI